MLSQLKEAPTTRELVILNLDILIKTIHQKRGYLLIIFLRNLREVYYFQEDMMWHRISNLYNKVKQELENQFLPLNSSISFGKKMKILSDFN